LKERIKLHETVADVGKAVEVAAVSGVKGNNKGDSDTAVDDNEVDDDTSVAEIEQTVESQAAVPGVKGADDGTSAAAVDKNNDIGDVDDVNDDGSIKE